MCMYLCIFTYLKHNRPTYSQLLQFFFVNERSKQIIELFQKTANNLNEY